MSSYGFEMSSLLDAEEATTLDTILVAICNGIKDLDMEIRARPSTIEDWSWHSHEIMANLLNSCSAVRFIISETSEDPIETSFPDAKFGVAFNAMGRSNNFINHGSVGGVFGVFKIPVQDQVGNSLFGQSARKTLTASGYYLFGSCCILVLTVKTFGVKRFILNPLNGKFILENDKVTIKPDGKIYSCNEGHSKFWIERNALITFINAKKEAEIPYKSRYSGSFVADVHRILIFGGIYLCPSFQYAPSGKVRLLYDCFPMSLIAEEAGGKATDGRNDILDLEMRGTCLHQTIPFYIGSYNDMNQLMTILHQQRTIKSESP